MVSGMFLLLLFLCPVKGKEAGGDRKRHFAVFIFLLPWFASKKRFYFPFLACNLSSDHAPPCRKIRKRQKSHIWYLKCHICKIVCLYASIGCVCRLFYALAMWLYYFALSLFIGFIIALSADQAGQATDRPAGSLLPYQSIAPGIPTGQLSFRISWVKAHSHQLLKWTSLVYGCSPTLE